MEVSTFQPGLGSIAHQLSLAVDMTTELGLIEYNIIWIAGGNK
jgi:hypothetical protein